jgi:hypothetical protein
VALIYIFFMARDGEKFFLFFGHLDFFLWKGSVLLPISSSGHWFLGRLAFWVAVYSGYQSLIWCVAAKIFFLFCGYPLQFRNHFFCCAEAF